MSFTVHQGDALAVLRTLPAHSFDGCLTDPPYHLTQASRNGSPRVNDPETPFGRTGIGSKGFMGKAWDGGDVAFRPETWREVLRVLKPGAMLLAFGGSRTHHRLMCAIEDAGFEIRDCAMWLYGSGFPKSLDISKALDKRAGIEPASDAARTWDGYGTALKPAWEPIIIAMKPCEGAFAENALKWGVAGLAIDAGRLPVSTIWHRSISENPAPKFDRTHAQDCWTKEEMARGANVEGNSLGRWPANVLLDEEAAAQLDQQSGTLTSGANPSVRSSNKFANTYGAFNGQERVAVRDSNSGGASRFFYTAKASGSERNANLHTRENDHPTVKPVDLDRYLAKLILPPERDTPRRLLVPFCGSGSEILGAMAAGWDEAVGVEISAEYAALSRARIQESAPLFLRADETVSTPTARTTETVS